MLISKVFILINKVINLKGIMTVLFTVVGAVMVFCAAKA
jgi:hypothetical protein